MDRRSLLPAFLSVLLGACRNDAASAPSEAVPDAALNSVAIADTSEALTFARIPEGGVLAVTSYREGIIEGVDLSAAFGRSIDDPVAVFLTEGYDALRNRIVAAPSKVRIPADQLIAPLDLAEQHIAAGTNYPEHAADAGVEDGPFLFAKLVTPTGPYAPVTAGDRLLDYEVELAWVTLEPLAKGASPRHMGMIACNDYTDRATLLRSLNPSDVASGDGFTTGKSFPGYLPVGNLFVIPRDFRTFARTLQLELYVNEMPRQKSPANAMVWDFDEILSQTWARQNTTWEHRGARIALPGAGGVIPARTLVMAGTPHGTVFDGISTRQMVAGAMAWLLGGWSKSPPAHVITGYIKDAQASGIYLQPRDRVLIRIDKLGVIHNEVR